MKEKTRRRRCLYCNQLFSPDPRCRERQRHCPDLKCRLVSKAASQLRWKSKPENRNHWRGPSEVERIREWRKKHPGYWRRAKSTKKTPLQDQRSVEGAEAKGKRPDLAGSTLQEEWRRESPLVIGLVSMFVGGTLQDDIATVCRDLIAKGREILGARNPKNGVPA